MDKKDMKDGHRYQKAKQRLYLLIFSFSHFLIFSFSSVLILSFSHFLILSCSRGNDDHQAVRQAAEQYYGYLIEGDIDSYMRGLADYDSLPESYRGELRDMFLQYVDRERQMRQGIVSAEAVRDTLVDSLHAHVFLNIQFGDSTLEMVSLPLVRTDKGWRMK